MLATLVLLLFMRFLNSVDAAAVDAAAAAARHDVPVGDKAPEVVNCIIEIPAVSAPGSRCNVCRISTHHQH
jgi:hypothetical protein